MKKAIIFEEVTNRNLWLARIYQVIGYEVFCFRFHASIVRKKENSLSQWIKKIPFNPQLHYSDGYFDTEAFRQIDIYYGHFCRAFPLLGSLQRLYKDDRVDLILRGVLMKKLSRFTYLKKNFSRLNKELNAYKKMLFVPRRGAQLFQVEDLDCLHCRFFNSIDLRLKNVSKKEMITFPWWCLADNHIRAFFLRCRNFFQIMSLPFFLLSKTMLRSVDCVAYKIGVMVLSQRQFEYESKPVDFLIDDEKLKKSDVIFIPYNSLTQSQEDHLTSKELNFISNVNTAFRPKYIREIIPSLFRSFIFCVHGDVTLISTSWRLLFYYVKWKSLQSRLSLDHLVSQNTDTVSQALARDILFSHKGTQIWKYMDSASLANYFTSMDNFHHVKEHYFTFMFADHLISWSKDNTDVLKSTRSEIGNYHEIGCLWSELASHFKVGRKKSVLKDLVSKSYWNKNTKVIGLFDSTFTYYIRDTYEDGISFLEDVLKLIRCNPNIIVVFKEKKQRMLSISESPDLEVCYKRLESHPRFISVRNEFSPSEIISVSDLVISYPFTSPGLEALGAGVRSIWHDASGKYQESFYDQIPQLVTHSFDELQQRSRALLEMTNQDYKDYLLQEVHKRCPLNFELDGITKFRRLLVSA